MWKESKLSSKKMLQRTFKKCELDSYLFLALLQVYKMKFWKVSSPETKRKSDIPDVFANFKGAGSFPLPGTFSEKPMLLIFVKIIAHYPCYLFYA